MTAIRRLEEFRLHPDGFEIHRNVLTRQVGDSLKTAIDGVIGGESIRPHGVRSIAERCAEIGGLVQNAAVRRIVEGAISKPWRLVRSIFFDKVPDANWQVGWHQDLTIAVRDRPAKEPAGFSGWTEKEGVPHVQAPAALLGRMVTLRIHLDDADSENGPLRVIPGSHESRLDSGQIRARIETGPEIECTVGAGDVVAMRPMLLHASRKATAPNHRRIVHLEFGPADGLPDGMKWAAAT